MRNLLIGMAVGFITAAFPYWLLLIPIWIGLVVWAEVIYPKIIGRQT